MNERKEGEEDDVDGVRIDVLLPQGDQRGRTEIHREARPTGIDQDAGLEAPAAAEGIAGAYESCCCGHLVSPRAG